MELRDYVMLARARALTLVTLFLLGVIAAGGYALLSTPVYTATAEVVVITQRGSSAQELVQSGDYSQKQVRSYSAIAQRPVVLGPVITALGLDLSTAEMARKVSVTSPLNTVLISIAVSDQDPETAARIANAISHQLAVVVARLEPATATGAPSVRLEPIRSAEPPQSPSAPRLKVTLALGAVGGLVAGVCVVALREALNTRVRSVADIASIVDAAPLGTVTFDVGAEGRPLLTDTADHSPRAESFRQIRTNIKFLGAVEPHTVLAVTSSVPGEGKSTTAANLAITLGAAGERVCLVEADLRRPRLAQYLGLEGAVGLTTVLIGDAQLTDVIQPWGERGLDVLLSGQVPPNPSELLGSERMAALLTELRASYDTVIIDCPPLVPVTDGALMAKAAGGAILIVGSGKADRRDLAFAVETLESIGAPILGTIMNMVSPQEHARQTYGYAPTAPPAPTAPYEGLAHAARRGPGGGTRSPAHATPPSHPVDAAAPDGRSTAERMDDSGRVR
ncbi:polysaccharide biosynthesis tyrosine autokinase [Georgenia sp. SYP-B2076]|uniref:polysaccharide biosynthesis tyrosine autokinase n=1 Tax=Georgenia sp. SYP-B2076 TaxID=2495881 RepID=UPI000F8D77CA|nr:polysaccharide biosynthesis tyrosine autokinase [Georgenia sp. SYP-B2076]